MKYTKDLRKTVQKYSFIILIALTVIYGLFRAYPLVAGPSITIFYPQEGDIVASSTFEVSGRVVRSKEITLQGKSITVDTDGTFRETIVSLRPYTLIVLTATDTYGKNTVKTLKVVPE